MDLDAIVQQLDIPTPPEVLVGLQTSDDAGVYRLDGDLCLVMTADIINPTCDDPYLFGRIAAANSLSDVYAMGGQPKTCLNLCCFPNKGIDRNWLTEILRGSLSTITEADAVLLGGHTVKDDVLKYGLSVTGLVKERDLTPNSGAKPGDVLILTKPIGTGVVMAGAKKGLVDDTAATPIYERMAQLNRSACAAMIAVGVNAATDITGFGLCGHGYEVAKASVVGIRFFDEKVPCWGLAEELIRRGIKTGVKLAENDSLTEIVQFHRDIPTARQQLYVDPQTSGGLLISVPENKSAKLLQRLRDSGIDDAAICGEVFEAKRPHLEIEP